MALSEHRTNRCWSCTRWSDGVWQLDTELATRPLGSVLKRELLEKDSTGTLTSDVLAELQADLTLPRKINQRKT